MKPLNFSLFHVGSIISLLLLAGITVVWYHRPVPVERIDRLAYCACGYSTVRFDVGKIIMVKYHHGTVKPGEQIGTYRVVGQKVETEITFKGRTHKETFRVDNVGLVAQQPSLLRYYALNSNSPKTYIYAAISNLRSALTDLWDR